MHRAPGLKQYGTRAMAVEIRPYDPKRKPRNYSRKIEKQKWLPYASRLRSWHAAGLSPDQIQILLLQAGLTEPASKHQQERWMYQIRRMKGPSEFNTTSTSAIHIDASLERPSAECDRCSDDSSYTADVLEFEEAVLKHELASSAAAMRSLLKLAEIAPANTYAFGMVFAEVEDVHAASDLYKCNVFIVAGRAVEADNCSCIRIRTWGGLGLARFLEKLSPDDCRRDVNSYAIVYGSRDGMDRYTELEGEPRFKKHPLKVRLNDQVESDVLSPLSRACFERIQPFAIGRRIVVLGQLDEFSSALMQLYVTQLKEGVASSLSNV